MEALRILSKLQQALMRDISSSDPFMTVDPGLGGTGWALFESFDKPPSHYGVLEDRKGKWVDRARRIANDFGGLVRGFENPAVIIEWPGFWGGSVKSFASMERGDLFKLCFLIGNMSAWCENPPHLISPQVWKGQLSKEAVKNRIIRAYGAEWKEVGDHIADAIGIGLAMGSKL